MPFECLPCQFALETARAKEIEEVPSQLESQCKDFSRLEGEKKRLNSQRFNAWWNTKHLQLQGSLQLGELQTIFYHYERPCIHDQVPRLFTKAQAQSVHKQPVAAELD